jgi:hypothetical protein
MVDDRTMELLDAVVDRIVQHKYPDRIDALLKHLDLQNHLAFDRGRHHPHVKDHPK